MLPNIKTLLCLDSNTSCRSFLDIITKKSNNLIEVFDVSTLERNIKDWNTKRLCVLFIDLDSMVKLSEETSTILTSPNFICILLIKNINITCTRKAYIYDTLACDNPDYIDNFLRRLEADLKYRLDYQFLQNKLKRFDDISMKLTTEKNINNLLELIVDSSMELTYAEAGTIYIVVDRATEEWSYYESSSEDKCLKFALAKNKALIVNLEQTILPINKSSINGYSVITREPIRIDDVYSIREDADYKFNSSFDKITGYKTKSMLNVPLKDHNDHVLGVIQLINKQIKGNSVSFDDTDELMAASLSGLAAVAIENAILYKTNEKLLESRTRKLKSTEIELNNTQMQLIQKEKMAAVGQLAAGIAHEINNPLGFVISNNDTVQKYIEKLIGLIDKYKDFSKSYYDSEELSRILDYESKSKFDFIKSDLFDLYKENSDGLKRIGVIVNALRAFSSIDQLDNFQEHDINECIQDTLAICSNKLKYTSITVAMHLSDIPYVKCNSGEINQVILNIIFNSIDAIFAKDPAGMGSINIKTYIDDSYVCFDIEDDGIGIQEEIQNKIFEPFYTTKPVGEGTGLGLSICYDIIVKKHHGEILLNSNPGMGSKFTVMLPIN